MLTTNAYPSNKSQFVYFNRNIGCLVLFLCMGELYRAVIIMHILDKSEQCQLTCVLHIRNFFQQNKANVISQTM